MEVKYRISTDCTDKIRVYYRFDKPFSDIFLNLFPDAQTKIDEFSKKVKGAKDHFIILYLGQLYASGVFGDNTLVVTYNGTSRGIQTESKKWFEKHLQKAGYLLIEEAKVLSFS
ncbi:MAG: hypothetical protein ACE5D6_00155 [Candidatus Zixiibacteriota bacterium]